MNYCGIDLAGVSSYAFVTDEKGNKRWAGPIATEKIAFERLVKKFAGEWAPSLDRTSLVCGVSSASANGRVVKLHDLNALRTPP